MGVTEDGKLIPVHHHGRSVSTKEDAEEELKKYNADAPYLRSLGFELPNFVEFKIMARTVETITSNWEEA